MRKKLPLIDGVEPACERCAFWLPTGPHEYDETIEEGKCRRYPPARGVDPPLPINTDLAANVGNGFHEWQWPVTCSDDWCGEFRKAEYEEDLA